MAEREPTADPAFDNATVETGVILPIALADFLVRRKERAPEEEEEPGAA